ncbi:BRCA1-associated RING domain protein 1-like [Actinia tenebrosa]|uniref:BRCA1-associated RING domain protein 1-like n=1 Tax=Actinia tenebrosa TaxID=6105 RepID=A0A6P8IAX8_ACTTE|nr:BRCA1-associated RING domain protein 1-like [Actinia tenebrosa]
MIKWNKTKLALSNLERLLTCTICKRLVQDPCTLEACDHHFCRNCVEELVGIDSKCPECGAFAWSKDLKVNRRLADILSLCKLIRTTVGNNDDVAETPPKQEACGVNVMLGTASRNLEKTDKIAKDNDIVTSIDGDKTLLKHNWQPVVRSEEGNNNTNNSSVCEREEYDVHLESSCSSQEYENEDINSSIELFSTNDSFCSEQDVNQPGTKSKYSTKTCGKESDIVTCTKYDKDRGASFVNHQNILKSKTNAYIRSDVGDLQVKGKKRKMSESELGIGNRESNLSLQKQVSIVENGTPETEKSIMSQSDVKGDSSSNKKRSRLALTHKNVSTSPSAKANISTPQSKIRKKLNTSPASVKSILELSPAHLTKRNKRGEGLLHIAAIKGYYEDAKYLLEKGADPNARDNAGWSPLHESCNHGHVTIAELLLDNGAIVNLPGGPEHETPLHDAVANGQLEVARVLVRRGASLHARNNQGLTPIEYAFTDPMKRLLEQESSVQCQTLTNDKENILLQTNLPPAHQSAKVLLYTGLSTEQKEKLELCASILGGKLVNEFSIDVTHIITSTSNSGLCRRTIKYLSGILCGKWIVSFGWITKCLSTNKWVDEAPYEVKGTSTAKSGVPHQARVNHLQQLPGLFDGCQFFFSGTFDPKTPSKEDLISLVKYGGGKILTREPKQEIDYSPFIIQSKYNKDTMHLSTLSTVAYHAQPDSTQYRCTIYIIYDPLSQNKQAVRNVRGPSIAPVGWLLDCISKFEIIDIEKFLQR